MRQERVTMNKLVEAFTKNRDFLDRHKDSHPHGCRTKTGYPTPPLVSMKLPQLDHISAPILKEREWGFRTAEDMHLFKTQFVTLDNAD